MRVRQGLRVRLSLAFAVGSLIVSAGLALITYETARSTLLRQRDTSATRQAFVNARLLLLALRGEPDVPQVLASIGSGTGTRTVLRFRGEWFAYPVGVRRESLPTDVVRVAAAGAAARQRTVIGDDPQLVVAVPVPAAEALYFEISPLDQLEVTLALLRNALLAAAGVTTVMGATFGAAVSNRVLRPVRLASRAAAEVAAGHLDAGLDDRGQTELHQLARAFNAMTAALRERIERDRRFVAAVSHELRSPLMTLVAAVEVLQARRADLPERSQVAVDLVASEVGRFERLVQDLLEISRLDAGAVELPEEEVAIGRLLRHVLDGLPLAGAEVALDPDAVDAPVRADKRRFERVMANLVDNAAFYGGGATRVALSRDGDRVRITVDDAGPGLAEDERERIFERFERGQAAGSRGAGSGTGLGLSIVAEHVALHGGRVWAEAADAGGARFVVELPVAGAGAGAGA